MGESLVSKQLLKRTEAEEYFRMHPDINVIKIGGQSIMDRGGKALFPILEALIKAKDKHKILLMTGGGTRARHVYNIGVDLGMPTGVLSKLGDKVSWQNAEMLSVLLAKHGGVKIGHGDNLEQLTMFCRLGYMPITYGIPPYGFFEHPAEYGAIPPHRTDCGAFLLAENIGARSLIFFKIALRSIDKTPIPLLFNPATVVCPGQSRRFPHSMNRPDHPERVNPTAAAAPMMPSFVPP
jgi:molybdenum storage protein